MLSASLIKHFLPPFPKTQQKNPKRYLNGSLPYVQRHITVLNCVECVVNKTLTFLLSPKTQQNPPIFLALPMTLPFCRNTKPHRPMNQERSNSENRSLPERHQLNTAPRMSPRGLDNAPQLSMNRHRGGEHNANHSHMSSGQPHGVDANANIMHSGRPMESQTQK